MQVVLIDHVNSSRIRHGRWGSVLKNRERDNAARIAVRAERRGERLSAAARDLPSESLTYEALSELAGVPVGYLRWRYPSQTDLFSLQEQSLVP